VFSGRLQIPAVLGLTATATRAAQSTLQRALRVPSGSILRASVRRENLLLSASMGGNSGDRFIELERLLSHEPFKDLQSIIVYATTQAMCDSLAERLVAAGVKAIAYHAGKTAIQRTTAQDRFMKGNVRVVVATIAFGMGLDKKDVRAVIHYNVPRTVEHYVQEIGRAGRDGLPAFCHCFYHPEDAAKLDSLSHAEGIELTNVRELLQRIFCQARKSRWICSDSVGR